MDELRRHLAELLAAALPEQGSEALARQLVAPPQREFGDLAFPCFALAKERQKNPAAVAKELAAALSLGTSLERLEATGPYVNFTFRPEFLAQQVLRAIFLQKDHYGHSSAGEGRTVVIEFSSPNIAKPFGIGHLRSTNIGACLARVYAFLGYKVIRLNHLGDWGTQFGKLITAYKRFGSAEFLRQEPLYNLYQLYVRYHEEEAAHPELADEARQWFAKLENGDEEALELWQWFRDLSLQAFQSTYKMLGVEFDFNWGESFYRDKIAGTLARLSEKGLLERSQEALIVRFPEETLPPLLVKKSDDSTLYATRDLCAAEYRHEKFHFDKMIYVVGTPQQLHFRQVFRTLELMGYPWAKSLRHVDFGHISLAGPEGGAMSTRKGNVVLLQEVIDQATQLSRQWVEKKNPELLNREEIARQIGLGAVLFADLSSRRQKEVKFDWNEILNFDGETGPYLQYAYVRLKSLEENFSGTIDLDIDCKRLSTPEERELLLKLSALEEVLAEVIREDEPFFLARYLLELAKSFSRFYHACRIIDPAHEPLTRARMLLAACTAIALKNGLTLLGISTPERM